MQNISSIMAAIYNIVDMIKTTLDWGGVGWVE